MTIRIPVWLRAASSCLRLKGQCSWPIPRWHRLRLALRLAHAPCQSAERTTEVGCYLTATEFWAHCNNPTGSATTIRPGPPLRQPRDHMERLWSRFGKVWLYTIADANWRPAGGDRIAVIGPLQLAAGNDNYEVYEPNQ